MKSLLLTLLISLLSATATPTAELTAEDLTTRTPEKIIVEYCEGFKTSPEGDGIITNTTEDYCNYISYRYIDAELGEPIQTYFVYNPLNQYEDDIIIRVDLTADGNVYIN